MKILEILLPKNVKDKDISPKHARRIDSLQQRMTKYVDKIGDPSTSAKGREFLKAKLKDDYDELKNVISDALEESNLNEAVNKLPLTDSDFKLVKQLMSNPIPAIVAPIYLQEFLDDDEFTCMLQEWEETSPAMDVRPHVVEWFKRVMPDQMYRFTDDVETIQQKMGEQSVIHGYEPSQYHGANEPITGNAYGRR